MTKEQLANYLRHKSRLNHTRRTLDSSFTSTMLFLDFYRQSGKYDLKDVESADLKPSPINHILERLSPLELPAIEHGQDWGAMSGF